MNKNKRIEIMSKALKRMPDKFTSHFFKNELRRLGVSEGTVLGDTPRQFLYQKCRNAGLNKNRTWYKQGNTQAIQMLNEKVRHKSSLEEASLKDLKIEIERRGYRVSILEKKYVWKEKEIL